MGHNTDRPRNRAALGALLAALSFLLLASTALALPTHARKASLDIPNLNHACGVGVDSKGDVYASSAGTSEVKVYNAAHALLTSIADSNEPCGLAVTTTGVLYVSEKATGEVVRFKPNAYPFAGTPTYGPREVIDSSGIAKGIAVDPVDNLLYVAEGTRVAVYKADGSFEANIEKANEVQVVTVSAATGGAFTLTFKEEETAAIPFNVSATMLKERLEALSTIGAGNVTVSLESGKYTVTFTAALADTDVETLMPDFSSLEGSGAQKVTVVEQTRGFSGFTEATGVAAYTYSFNSGSPVTERYLWVADAAGADHLDLFRGQSVGALKLRRELTGANTPDGSFGFGAAGAYLAEDPGNRNPSGECKVVGEQACTAGHLFLFDATHKALDEFDASGEYLDQTKNAAFTEAGAEPTAVAIDRSGGSTDGTIYVTAGSGAGAEALAFEALKAPSRAVLGTPLSHILAGAKAVATDSHGYVYVGAESAIHIYKPNGAEVLSIEDPSKPKDLAVDSTGKVYVLDDGEGGFASEREVTYYAPSAYPPLAGTTYTRRAEPIAIPEDFAKGGSLLKAIAVDPGPGPGKDRLFLTSNGATHLYDSAAEESELLSEEFANGIVGTRQSLAVNGANGTVYIATNTQGIWAVNETGTEVLARFLATGSTKTKANPYVAVDQANGHVVEFDETHGAREYDAAGAFVAEFGNFTEGMGSNYWVAVDSACAIHEPPLSGAACEAFDPANGTAYVAYDDLNPNHPPYDVNAFGGLFYPQAGEPPLATTGIADEFGPDAATLHGTVDPNATPLEECRFEYLPDSEYQENVEAHPGDEEAAFEGAEAEECAETPEEIGEESDPVPVHAEVEGLAEMPYRFRLIATNVGGSSAGKAVLFGPPLVSSKSALPILYHEATLRAEVDPSGLATEYRFEYLDRQSFEEQGGFEGPATHHTDLGELAAGETPVAVSAALTGLGEGTEYLFRAVAKNADARVVGATEAFVTQARRPSEECTNAIYRFGLSSNLPDCRAYELVTPAQTDGLTPYAARNGTSPSGAFSNWLTIQRGDGAGERLSYFTDGTLPGFEGNGALDGYRAERGAGEHPAGGWQSALFSPDYVESAPGILHNAVQNGVAADQLYSSWEIDSGSETFLGTLPEGVYLRTPAGFEVLGRGSLGEDLGALSRYLSAGGAHAIFASSAHLEEKAAPSGTAAIYDRAAGDSSGEVVSVKPDGSAFGAGQGASYAGASEDGAAVTFRVGGTLYLHRASQTTEIATAPNTFAGISEDGRRVFYAAGADGQLAAGLYACDAEAGPCAGEGAHPPTKIATAGIFALVSPDGSHAFFSSTEALSGSEENENGETAQPGTPNLYVWDAAGVNFIGRLVAADLTGGGGFAGQVSLNLAAWTQAISRDDQSGRALAPARSTPSGGAFAFQSHARLTAYDNEGKGEVYRYDPAAIEGERLLCVSCDPSGTPPSGDALFEDIRPFTNTPVQSTTMIANLTDDGQEAFFQSPDRLLPEDANEVEDVYEWKAKGAGGCTRPGGCLALISSGQGEAPSFLYAMSGDGHDVFFQTKEQLVGMDVPGSPSIYDARVGGGIPEPAPPAPCQGDACQGVGTLPPALPNPASTGGGEAGGEASSPPASCAKGKHRVKGRCVAAKHHKNRRHRRAHTKRGGKR